MRWSDMRAARCKTLASTRRSWPQSIAASASHPPVAILRRGSCLQVSERDQRSLREVAENDNLVSAPTVQKQPKRLSSSTRLAPPTMRKRPPSIGNALRLSHVCNQRTLAGTLRRRRDGVTLPLDPDSSQRFGGRAPGRRSHRETRPPRPASGVWRAEEHLPGGVVATTWYERRNVSPWRSHAGRHRPESVAGPTQGKISRATRERRHHAQGRRQYRRGRDVSGADGQRSSKRVCTRRPAARGCMPVPATCSWRRWWLAPASRSTLRATAL